MAEKRGMKASELVKFIQKYDLEDFSVVITNNIGIAFHLVIRETEDAYLFRHADIDVYGDYSIVEVLDDYNASDEGLCRPLFKGNILEEIRNDR